MRVVNSAYGVSTGLLALMMAGSTYAYFTSPDMLTAFQHLGFPSFFRQQLDVFKILGVVALLAPVPARVKEWA
ncbi:DoxX family protein [Hymenobacter terrenus]|uniref:DoxX family protein n=1 Tax=Hymenobacter terrenus TaxID=1629124 RepID=UPI0009E3312B|nr:DoxX family protein [Hymenobacter terrenus]